MIQLEPGEYFAVERGRLLTPAMDTPMGNMPAQYDCTYEGCVFKLLVQNHMMWAVEVVYPANGAGWTLSLDVTDMELMPVTPSYVTALQDGKQYKKPPMTLNPLLDVIRQSQERQLDAFDNPINPESENSENSD